MSAEIKETIRKEAKEKNVRFLRLMFTDIDGVIKNVEVPVSQLEKVMDNEMAFDGSSIDGFVEIDQSDMKLEYCKRIEPLVRKKEPAVADD